MVRSVAGIVVGVIGVGFSIAWFMGTVNQQNDIGYTGTLLAPMMLLICLVMLGSAVYQFVKLKN